MRVLGEAQREDMNIWGKVAIGTGISLVAAALVVKEFADEDDRANQTIGDHDTVIQYGFNNGDSCYMLLIPTRRVNPRRW